ncbi:methyltransferase domain-containing protein [Catalinimonas sp. 4WD22]|uniref:class I SAM-dependent methyltransferase n=1 Tax=Catalinimonas locisalis TaxID=3133978 RepID=UPI0031012FEC
MHKLLNIPIAFLLLASCAPYAKGPVFTLEKAEDTFQPIVDFMEIQPGMAVADFGAGSGALTVIMAMQLDRCTVYIQDIDHKVLQQKNVNKMIAYYSTQLGYDLGKHNQFHVIYGTTTQSNLPDRSIDRIYSNATMHVLDTPDVVLQDLRNKLKADGKIFIRDSFRGDHGEGEFCPSSDCGKRLLSIDEFLTMMTKNGYRLSKQAPDMDGYPVFGFELNE